MLDSGLEMAQSLIMFVAFANLAVFRSVQYLPHIRCSVEYIISHANMFVIKL